jgi:phosphoribosylformimino-5-aminoimidazole carboxamide ribotide isomerase
MMNIYPAIDLYKNRVVRLYQGKYSEITEYPVSAPELARSYVRQGAQWVHLVDLEGAEKGHPVHLDLVKQLSSEGIYVQFGGGLRSIDAIDLALDSGARRVYVGSLLARDENSAEELYSRWGNRIIPAVDIRNRKVAVSGWKETVEASPESLLSRLYKTGFRTVLITSIQRDGTSGGPDIMLYSTILNKIPDLEIIAAGGISSIEDVIKLNEAGCSGAVLGKSLCEGKIELNRLLEVLH